MDTRLFRASTAAAVLMLLCVSAPAGAQYGASAGRSAPEATKDPQTLLEARASELLGKKVADPQGKELGEVEDLIIDLRGGHMPHVILAHGAIREKLFIYPANAFTRDEIKDRLVLNAEREGLRQSRGFDRSNWPFQPPLWRVSELRGRNVKNAQGKAAGEIEDFVIDLRAARVKHVVLAQDGRKGPEDKMMVPLASLQMPEKRGEPVVLKK